MKRLIEILELPSKILIGITMVNMLVLIGVMGLEVISRRVFNAPTIWAFDISYMLAGLIFICAASYTLKKQDHIRIDFLVSAVPWRIRRGMELTFICLLMIPSLYPITQAAISTAYTAFQTGELERVSPWAPVIWPYFTGLAVGLAALLTQMVAELLKLVNDSSELKTPTMAHTSQTAGPAA